MVLTVNRFFFAYFDNSFPHPTWIPKFFCSLNRSVCLSLLCAYLLSLVKCCTFCLNSSNIIANMRVRLLKVPGQKKFVFLFMIKTCVYSTENLKLYRCFKYIKEKMSKSSNFSLIMLFVGL